MRILHVIPAMTWERGGPAAVVAALTRHQVALGHQVSVLTTDQGARRGERPIELSKGVEQFRASVWGPDRFAFAPRLRGMLASQLRETDLMHVHSVFRYPCLAAIKVAAKMPCAVVVRPCGVLHRYGLSGRSAIAKSMFLLRYGKLYRSVCDAWHYTSPNEEAQSWPWEKVDHSFVLPNGIDPEQFAVDRAAARRAVSVRWPECGSGRYVLFLGRLHQKKRVDLLLQAFLSGAPADVKLVIAGHDEDSLWPPLQRRYLADDVQAARVVRIGLVTGEAKCDLLAGASLFALASEHENFGNSVLEALAAGTPVLGSSNVDLVRDLAEHGLAHVDQLDLDAWSRRLNDLLVEEVVQESFVRSARSFVSNRYSWNQVARQLLDEYAKLCRT